jgi:prevent-host-death family protein
METMGIAAFKAQCISVLKRVHHDRERLVITWRGKPLARIEPVAGPVPARRLGALKGRLLIKGDIVHADWSGDWEAGR